MAHKDYYDEYWSPEGFNPSVRLQPALQRRLEESLRTDMEVLDVGCGDGQTYGVWLKERVRSYVGVDIASNAVERACAAGLDARQIDDAASLPFQGNSFDACVCMEVFEHLFEPHLAAKEIARILRPNGILIATVPNVAYWRRRVDFALLGRWNPLGDDLAVEQPWRDPHIRFFNPGAFKRMLTRSGFSSVHVTASGGSIAGEIPWVGKRFRGDHSTGIYQLAQRASPSLFGYRLVATAKMP